MNEKNISRHWVRTTHVKVQYSSIYSMYSIIKYWFSFSFHNM